jgi:hypothetical protein
MFEEIPGDCDFLFPKQNRVREPPGSRRVRNPSGSGSHCCNGHGEYGRSQRQCGILRALGRFDGYDLELHPREDFSFFRPWCFVELRAEQCAARNDRVATWMDMAGWSVQRLYDGRPCAPATGSRNCHRRVVLSTPRPRSCSYKAVSKERAR